MSETTIKVLDIQRLSTEDGPGLRTTTFVKGCPLKCAWCHNPESIQPKEQMIWLENHCIGCRLCEKNCPNEAIKVVNNCAVIDYDKCDGCGKCAEACKRGCIEL